jgi:uncharacterized membrane protein
MSDKNPNSRLEAFCDGVFAFALTLLIIDIKIPSTATVNNSADLWRALYRLAPSVFTFILSFAIILITWVNHHNALKLAGGSSSSFIYANGFLLLTIVFLPFPTALMGEYLFTEMATPAVILYNAVMALQSFGWVLMSNAALKSNLPKNEKSRIATQQARMFGLFAIVTYVVLGVAAIWVPVAVAGVITLIWIFWLIYGISIKGDEPG